MLWDLKRTVSYRPQVDSPSTTGLNVRARAPQLLRQLATTRGLPVGVQPHRGFSVKRASGTGQARRIVTGATSGGVTCVSLCWSHRFSA
jgi:hypothetical protein